MDYRTLIFHLRYWLAIRSFSVGWRRERDSNPRSRFKRNTRLAGEPLRPLGHLSVLKLNGLPSEAIAQDGGGSRIRTHVPFRRSGFQDRRLKPLGHPSILILVESSLVRSNFFHSHLSLRAPNSELSTYSFTFASRSAQLHTCNV